MSADEFNRGLEIALKADNSFSGYGDSKTNLRMLLKDRKGSITERVMEMNLLEVPEDGDKSLIIINNPRDLRGTAVLSHAHKVGADEQWLYMPALKRVKRVASKTRTGPFFGSEFSFEDLSFQEIEKYSYEYLRDENLEGKECHVIKRIPLDPYSGYTKQIVWISKTDPLIHQIHHYDRKSFHFKTQIFKGYQKYLNKFWRPNEIHMVNHQTNKTTTLFFEDMAFNTGLSDKDFTQNSLKRSK
jgi:outer membrane lipoprotein-sorting protein